MTTQEETVFALGADKFLERVRQKMQLAGFMVPVALEPSEGVYHFCVAGERFEPSGLNQLDQCVAFARRKAGMGRVSELFSRCLGFQFEIFVQHSDFLTEQLLGVMGLTKRVVACDSNGERATWRNASVLKLVNMIGRRVQCEFAAVSFGPHETRSGVLLRLLIKWMLMHPLGKMDVKDTSIQIYPDFSCATIKDVLNPDGKVGKIYVNQFDKIHAGCVAKCYYNEETAVERYWGISQPWTEEQELVGILAAKLFAINTTVNVIDEEEYSQLPEFGSEDVSPVTQKNVEEVEVERCVSSKREEKKEEKLEESEEMMIAAAIRESLKVESNVVVPTQVVSNKVVVEQSAMAFVAPSRMMDDKIGIGAAVFERKGDVLYYKGLQSLSIYKGYDVPDKPLEGRGFFRSLERGIFSDVSINYKGRVLEDCQKRKIYLPTAKFASIGPAHNLRFYTVLYDQERIVVGMGDTKGWAEQDAYAQWDRYCATGQSISYCSLMERIISRGSGIDQIVLLPGMDVDLKETIEGACIVMSRGHEYGLIKERPKKPYNFPGGRCEDDESPFQALKRELKEELGDIDTACLDFTTAINSRGMRSSCWVYHYPTTDQMLRHPSLAWLKLYEAEAKGLSPWVLRVIAHWSHVPAGLVGAYDAVVQYMLGKPYRVDVIKVGTTLVILARDNVQGTKDALCRFGPFTPGSL